MALPIPCCSVRGGRSSSCRCHAILYVVLVLSFLIIHLIFPSATGNYPQLRRGRSLLAREEDDVHESSLALFKRGATLRRRRTQPQSSAVPPSSNNKKKKWGCWNGPGPGGPWMTYCLILTFFVPGFLLRSCGLFIPCHRYIHSEIHLG